MNYEYDESKRKLLERRRKRETGTEVEATSE